MILKESKTASALTNPVLLTEAQAAEYIGTAPGTLTVWRCTGRYNLPYVKVGRFVRYRQEDLDAWLAKRTQTHTGEAA
ncbi:MAG: helix-turn-helix domain-containing protein [Gammaproteobacteria bacterium]|nr:helix-turn-helix domain-containing protein [Gammaproteobacteria bacterium]